MSTTTPNYNLIQFELSDDIDTNIGTNQPANMLEIDTQMNANATSASSAQSTANGAQASIDSHEVSGSAHNASDINNDSMVSGAKVDTALNNLNNAVGTAQSTINNHITDAEDAHDDSAISNGSIASGSNVREALTNIKTQANSNESHISNGIFELNDFLGTAINVDSNPKALSNVHDSEASNLYEGRSIFNLADNGVDYGNWGISGTGSTKGANGIHLISDDGIESSTLECDFKPSTLYTFVLLFSDVTLDAVGDNMFTYGSGDTTAFENVEGFVAQNGIVKITRTTKSVIINNNVRFANYSANTNGTYATFKLLAIIEGDATSENITQELDFGPNFASAKIEETVVGGTCLMENAMTIVE